MKTQTLYFLNRLIGRGAKFLLETMIRCETDEFFNHKLESEMFWSVNFPYRYVNRLKIRALAKICDDLKEEIRQMEKEIGR